MRRKAVFWIVLFAAIFVSPFFSFSVLGRYLDSENYENRDITERPELSRANYADFPEEYEAYFNDNIPYRNQLVRLNSRLDLLVFGDSSSENVVVGKDGWLFYTGPGNPVEQSTGKTNFTEQELSVLAEKLMLAKAYIEAGGGEFVFFIAPNKESVYMDELPDYYPVVSDYTQVMQLVDYLRENTDIRVVWPYEELMEEKEKSDYYLYSHFDTHWGNIGAYVGARTLARELGMEMPALSELSVEAIPVSGGDLTKMLNLFIPNGDVEYEIAGYEVADGNEGEPLMEFHHEKGDERTLIMRRDSFGARLSKVLQHEFKNMYVSQSKDRTDDKADIFVYEIVERNIGELYIELDYVVCDVTADHDTKIITLASPHNLEYPCVSIFKKAENTDDWEAVQVASPLNKAVIEVPAGESGEMKVYFLADETGDTIVFEQTIYY